MVKRREREEDSDPPPKKTNAQKIAEQRAKAEAWRKSFEAVSSPNQATGSPAARRPTSKPSPGRRSTAAAAKMPSSPVRSSIPKKSPGRASKPKVSEKKKADSMVPPTKRARIESTSAEAKEPARTPTKKQKLEEGRARARLWSQQKPGLVSSAQSAVSPAKTKTSEEDSKPAAREKPVVEDDEFHNAEEMEGGVPFKDSEEEDSEDEDSEGEEQPSESGEEHYRKQLELAREEIERLKKEREASWVYGTSPQFIMSPQQPLLQQHQGPSIGPGTPLGAMPYVAPAHPMVASVPPPAGARFDTGAARTTASTVQVPPSMWSTFSANGRSPARQEQAMRKHTPEPASDQSSKSTPPLQEEEERPVDQFDVDFDQRKMPWLGIGLPLLVISIIVVVIAFFAIEDGGVVASTGGPPGLPPCFASNPPREEQEEQLGNCDLSKGHVPCPDGAVCSGGELKACVDQFFEVSEGRNMCVLSTTSNITLAKVEVLLSEWTVEHFCSIQGCSYAKSEPNKGAPYFDLSLVQSNVDVSERLLSLSDVLVVLSDKGKKTTVGLSEEYVNDRLQVPWWCQCAIQLIELFDFISDYLFFGIQLVAGLVWWLFSRFPLASGICCFLVFCYCLYQSRCSRRNSLMKDVANVRQLTYQMLMDDVTAEHVVLHLRDAVALDLYPTDKSKRDYIIHKVWPRVVADVKRDNRVQKMNVLVHGIPRDVWQWTAATGGKKQVSFDTN